MNGIYRLIAVMVIVLNVLPGRQRSTALAKEQRSRIFSGVANSLMVGTCSDDVMLSSQAAVDSFPLTHNCADITGALTISGADITHLDSLYKVQSVGALVITTNNVLPDLHGLENIIAISGQLTIQDNPLLNDITALNSLKSIEGDLIIYNNDNLKGITGLPAVQKIEGRISITGNDALLVFAPLDALTTLGGSITITDNAELVLLHGLNKLTQMSGLILIQNNASLFFMGGFDVLQATSDLQISDNENLHYMESFHSLIAVNVSDSFSCECDRPGVRIQNNPQLRSMNGLASLMQITYDGYGNLVIENNGMLDNLDRLNNLVSVAGMVFINNNTNLANINGLSSLRSIGVWILSSQSLIISNNPALVSLDGLTGITSLPGELSIDSNASLPDLDGLDSLKQISGNRANVYIEANNSLTNIDGLAALQKLEGGRSGSYFIIENNPLLMDVDGLVSLKSINGRYGYLIINNNAALTNVDSLASLVSITGAEFGLEVINNPMLARCCGLYPVLDNNGVGGEWCQPETCPAIQIENNGAGCTTVDILAAGPCQSDSVITAVDELTEAEKIFADVQHLRVRTFSGIIVKEQTFSPADKKTWAESLTPGLYIISLYHKDGRVINKKYLVANH